MRRDPSVLLLGEDIGIYGGAFGVTKGMVQEFGEERVRDTPLSEHAITGATAGAAYIVDPDHDELELAVTLGVTDEAAAAAASIAPLSESHDPLADVNRSRHPLEVDDAAHVEILHGFATALLLPLVVRREGIEISLGVMALGFAGPLPSHETPSARPTLINARSRGTNGRTR